ncbi:MAG: hypothetical protein V1733_07185 [bacterium]
MIRIDKPLLDHVNRQAKDSPERIYHSIFALEPGTIVYEIKDGPYSPIDDKNFASWAPKEGEGGTKEYIEGILTRLDIPMP